MRIRVCDYCRAPVVYEVLVQESRTVIDTCRQDVSKAIGVAVDNMGATQFSIKYVGEGGS